MRRHPRPGLRRALLAVSFGAAVVAACSPAPSQRATGPETTPGVEASRGVTGPGGGPSLVAPTAAGLIQAAVADGTLDAATGTLYRVYAAFGDARLPEPYRGAPSEDAAALEMADEHLTSYPAEIQAALRPYLVRPTDPVSVWTVGATAVNARGLAAVAAGPPCPGQWTRQDLPDIPVVVWGLCVGDAAETSARMSRVAGFLHDVWADETGYLGDPIGDENVPNDGYPDTPETGDQKLDVYVVTTGFDTRTPRWIHTGALASTRPAPPFNGPEDSAASSAYMVVDPGAGSDLELKSTIAHELFHVLQYAHNRRGIVYCVDPNCDDVEIHWFAEASATWAEHHFVPGARGAPDGPYVRFREGFRSSASGLNFIDHDNEYDSWLWPLFMQQELGDNAVAAAWTAIEGAVGYDAVQAALDSVLGFDDEFREFAVRVWNQQLNGNPIDPRFNDPRLDPTFPTDQPAAPRSFESFDLDTDSTFQETRTAPALWSWYHPFEIVGHHRQLELDLSGASSEFNGDVLLYIGDQWIRYKLDNAVNKICLDRPDQAAHGGIVVLSNHDQGHDARPISWSARVTEDGCSAVTGSITYQSSYDNGNGGTGSESLTATINLQSAPGDAGAYGQFVNAGSSGSASLSYHTVLPTGPDGCAPTMTGSGTAALGNEQDAITGGLGRPDGTNWVFTVAVSIRIHVEEDQNWCSIGLGHTSFDQAVQVPSCDGTEAAPGSIGPLQPSGGLIREFTIHCSFDRGGTRWTVSGSVHVSYSAP